MVRLKERKSVEDAEKELAVKVSDFIEPDVVSEILELYATVDKQHDSRHILDVVNHAEEIIQAFEEDLGPHRNIIILGAFMHDIGLVKGRKLHHFHSAMLTYRFLRGTKDLSRGGSNFTETDLTLIAACAQQHRASLKVQKWHSPASEAVATADRGKFELDGIIQRSFFDPIIEKSDAMPGYYTVDLIRELVDKKVERLIEKFGMTGYSYQALPQYSARLYGQNIDATKSGLTDRSKELKECWIEQIAGIVGAK